MRGHWVRRTEEVQEMRQFWKVYESQKEKFKLMYPILQELAIEKKDQQDIA